ncbi:histidine kinase [Vibrio sp. ZSDZ34]|uniref:Histidine kinase n=1 Tax=Vibrio gelatinilyticus TaxID=2893468 RepID=A0A9X1WB72_9VIBR|nr:histidine kinase [Vibrio gelatinilyticus]MCJ2376999.1 histidine kinase [Vibrio gelatinilyticus]
MKSQLLKTLFSRSLPLKTLFTKLSLTRNDLLLLVVWPIINSVILYSSIYYIMSALDKPITLSLAFRALTGIFSICALFWLLRRLFDIKFGTAYRYKLSHQILINLGLASLAIAIVSSGLPSPKTFDTMTMFQLVRLKLLTHLNLLLQVTIYTMVVHSWQLKQQALELEMSLKESEISLLRIQTNPHFLFNTLNLLHSEIPERPELAQELIFELSDLLRGTIAISDKKRILLSDEVELIEHYLAIQKARFTERLHFSIDIGEESQALQIPPMLIMPLVENVIKHAISKTINPIHLDVKTRYAKSELCITVCNSWPELTTPTFEAGSGHNNIIETLNLEYDHASFSMDFADDTSCANITIRHDF